MRRAGWSSARVVGRRRIFSSATAAKPAAAAAAAGPPVWTGLPVGLASGVVQGGVGIGGSIVMVTSLGWTGLAQLNATATSLVAQTFGNFSAAATFLDGGAVDLPLALFLTAPAVLSVNVGARLASRMKELHLKLAFTGMLCVLAPVLGFRALQGELHSSKAEPGAEGEAGVALGAAAEAGGAAAVAPAACGLRCEGVRARAEADLARLLFAPAELLGHVCVGVGYGCVTGLLGVGATPLLVSYLSLATEHPQKRVLGTAMAAVLPTFAVGALTHWRLGNVRIAMVPLLCAGTMVGGAVGARAALQAEDLTLRKLFAAFLVVSGGLQVRGCWKALKAARMV